MQIPTKEIATLKTQSTRAYNFATTLVITSDEEMLKAGDVRKNIKIVAKTVKERKEAITKPLNESLKSVRDLFRPVEEMCDSTESIIGRKMVGYQNEIENKRRDAELKAQKELEATNKKLEDGEITEKQAEKSVAKVEAKLEKAPEAITKSASFHTRTIKKYRILNEMEIPREYLLVDTAKIQKAMQAGVPIPGVEYYEDKTVV